MKTSKKLIGMLTLAGLLVLGSAVPASANLVTINPSGGTQGSNDLKIEIDSGSFIVTRDGEVQNYESFGNQTAYNGVILSIGVGSIVTAYATPRFDNAFEVASDFASLIRIGNDVLSNNNLRVTSEFYADISPITPYSVAGAAHGAVIVANNSTLVTIPIANHTFSVGDVVEVSGYTATVSFNGSRTITAVVTGGAGSITFDLGRIATAPTASASPTVTLLRNAPVGAYDPVIDAKLKIQMDYIPNTSYFTVTYTVTPATGTAHTYNLYHGIDMYLDGEDEGPAFMGTGLNSDFPGRYVVQANPGTRRLGGFIEYLHPYTSYYADRYTHIVDKQAFRTTGKKGPFYGEPLPDTISSDPDVDIGVGIHFDLGTGTTVVEKSTHVIFSAVGAAATLINPEPAPPAPYIGPLLEDFSSRTLDPCTPKSITITGTRLSGVTASIQGKSVTVLENTDTKVVLAFPAGLTPGSGVDLDINSTSGKLTFQSAFDIPANTCSLELSKGRWTQLQSDGKTVKMYAKDPVGDGKIQFFVDGKEIAWINAVDLTDPKLSFASSNPYLVRSVELKPGKNRFEIKLDGVRVWRATYVPKG